MASKKKNKCVCPDCGGRLTYEEFYQVSHIYKVRLDGRISKNFRRSDEGSEEAGFIACNSCGREWNMNQFRIYGDEITFFGRKKE